LNFISKEKDFDKQSLDLYGYGSSRSIPDRVINKYDLFFPLIEDNYDYKDYEASYKKTIEVLKQQNSNATVMELLKDEVDFTEIMAINKGDRR
jgi:hypothetical protein